MLASALSPVPLGLPPSGKRRIEPSKLLLRTAAALAGAFLGAAIPAAGQANVARGVTSGAISTTVTMKSAGTLSDIQVLTDGAGGQDFKFVSSTCVIGNQYAAGATCDVTWTFTANLAGVRRGGISLNDQGGMPMGIAYLSGTGTGPQVAFYRETESFRGADTLTYNDNLGAPLAADGAGNVYYVINYPGYYSIMRMAAGSLSGDVVANVTTGTVDGLAADGLGNLFYTAGCRVHEVTEFSNGTSHGSTDSEVGAGQYTSGILFGCSKQIAIDADGSLYAYDSKYGRVFRYIYGTSGYTSTGATPERPAGQYPALVGDLAVDSAKNVYLTYTDGTPLTMTHFDAGTGTYTDTTNPLANIAIPNGDVTQQSVAVDASGSIYVLGVTDVWRYSSTGGSSPAYVLSAFYTNIYKADTIRLDGYGNLFYSAHPGLAAFRNSTATLAFGSVNDGTPGPVDSMLVANIGNGPLNNTGLNLPTYYSIASGSGSPADCGLNAGGGTYSFPAGDLCTLRIQFAPAKPAAGALSGTFFLTANGMDRSNSPLINLTGTAVHPLPTITGITPNAGRPGGATAFTLTGTNLYDATAVTFTSATATNVTFTASQTDTLIYGHSPSGVAGSTAIISVTNPGGTSTSTAVTFKYNQTVVAYNSSLTLSPGNIARGGTATLTATVKDSSGNPIPNAYLIFASSNVLAADAPAPVATNASGVATATVTGIGPGTTTLSVRADDVVLSQTPVLTVAEDGVAVGSSANLSKRVLITADGTLAHIDIVGLGRNPYEFTMVSQDCSGVPLAIGSGCTVTYRFAPKAPGARQGAVVLTDSNGVVLGESYIGGIGLGPLGLVSPGVQTTVADGLSQVSEVAVDGSGRVYWVNPTSLTVFVDGTQTTLATGTNLVGVAVDGAGNVFYADGSNGNVYELVNGTGSPVLVTSLPSGQYPTGAITVDGLGNLYLAIGDFNVARLQAGTYSKTILGNAAATVSGVAVDSAGNVYFSDTARNVIYWIPFGSQIAEVFVNTGMNGPRGLAADAAGNVYVGTTTGLIRLSAGTRVATTLADGSFQGLRMDGSGLLWAATGSSVIQLDRTVSQPLGFSADASGSSPLQTLTLENDGNRALTLSGLTISGPFNLSNPATTCTSTISLTPTTAPCTLSVGFAPITNGTFREAISVTDNNLNVNGTALSLRLVGIWYGPQTITFAPLQNPAQQGSTVMMTATASSGLPVSYAVTSGPATIMGSLVTYTGTGTVVITATQAGNDTYAAADPVSQTIVVSYPATTIILSSSSGVSTYGTPVGLAATLISPSGTPTGSVSFYDGGTCMLPGLILADSLPLDGNGIAKFFTATLSATSHNIVACYTPTGLYGASSGSLLQQVNPATLTLSLVGSSGLYTSLPYTAACSITGGLVNGDILMPVLEYSSGPPPVNAGTYAANCTAGGNPNYQPANALTQIVIAPAPLTITARNQGMSFGAATPGFAADLNGFQGADGLAVVTGLAFTIYADGPLSTPVSNFQVLRTGAYPIVPSGAVAPNYLINYASGTLNVNKAALTGSVTITPADPQTLAFGQPATAVVYLDSYNIGGVGVLQAHNDPANANNPNNPLPPSLTVYLVPANGGSAQAVRFGTGIAVPTYDNTINTTGTTRTGWTVSITAGTPPPGLYKAVVYGDDPGNNSLSSLQLADAGYFFADTADIAYPTLSSNVLTVAPATLTITASGNSKVYGSTLTFAGTEFTVSGLASGDSVSSVTLASTGAAGTAAVSNSPYSIVPSAAQGTGLSHYSIVYATGSLLVTPAPLRVTANSTTKPYGQTLTLAGTEFTTSGLLNGDTVNQLVLTSAGAAATATVAGSTYSIVPSSAQGNGLGNYTITYANGSLAVTSAPLTITANSTKKTYGQSLTFAGTEFTARGLLNLDTAISVLLTSTGEAATATVAAPGPTYSIVPSAATGSRLANYTITYLPGTLTLNPAPLVITASSGTMVYGGTVPAVTPSIATFVNGDTIASLGASFQCSTTTTSGSVVGSYATACSNASNPNYAVRYIPGTISVRPAPLAATVTVSAPPTPRVNYQYSDPAIITISFPVTGPMPNLNATTATVSFGTQTFSNLKFTCSSTPILCTASTSAAPDAAAAHLLQAPGTYAVSASFTGLDVNFTINQPTTSLTVVQEDAAVTYNSASYFAVPATQTTVNIPVSFTLQDATATSAGGLVYDPYPGDITRTGTVTLTLNGTYATTAGTGNFNASCTRVTVNAVAGQAGSATTGPCTFANVPVNGTYTIAITPDAGSYYSFVGGNDTTVPIATSNGGGGFITGGGYQTAKYLASNPSHTGAAPFSLLGALSSKMNFGFMAKYNKNGSNIQSSVNIILRTSCMTAAQANSLGLTYTPHPGNDGLCVYQVKSNKVISMTDNPYSTACTLTSTACSPGYGVLVVGANIQDVTSATPVSLMGGGQLQLVMYDNSEPNIGNNTLTMQVRDKTGRLWFSNSWTGTKTAIYNGPATGSGTGVFSPVINAGNLQVR